MPDTIETLKRELRQSLADLRIRKAAAIYAELTEQHGLDPDSDDMLPSRVMLGVFDDRVMEMLQLLNGLDEDRTAHLKAICLQLIGDPLWEGIAEQVESTTEDEVVRRSMRSLLRARDIASTPQATQT